MREFKVAIRYARALVKLAAADALIDDVRSDMDSFISVLIKSKPLFAWLSDERVHQAKRLKLIQELSKAIGMQTLTTRFLEVILKERRMKNIKDIFTSYCSLADAAKGVVRGEITSISPDIGAKVKDPIEASLKSGLKKDVKLTLATDTSMIGGIKIRINDQVWDYSLKKTLEEIKQGLI